MEKDSIRNQKVFVTLESVLLLQEQLRRATQNDSTTYYAKGLQKAIEILQLPINTR